MSEDRGLYGAGRPPLYSGTARAVVQGASSTSASSAKRKNKPVCMQHLMSPTATEPGNSKRTNQTQNKPRKDLDATARPTRPLKVKVVNAHTVVALHHVAAMGLM